MLKWLKRMRDAFREHRRIEARVWWLAANGCLGENVSQEKFAEGMRRADKLSEVYDKELYKEGQWL